MLSNVDVIRVTVISFCCLGYQVNKNCEQINPLSPIFPFFNVFVSQQMKVSNQPLLPPILLFCEHYQLQVIKIVLVLQFFDSIKVFYYMISVKLIKLPCLSLKTHHFALPTVHAPVIKETNSCLQMHADIDTSHSKLRSFYLWRVLTLSMSPPKLKPLQIRPLFMFISSTCVVSNTISLFSSSQLVLVFTPVFTQSKVSKKGNMST